MERKIAVIDGRGIRFSYESDPRLPPALEGVDMKVWKGELVAILGGNGSGKSTLARHLNALLPLQDGCLTVCGIDAKVESDIWKLRRLCGMVFQNPDNQFVSSVVEEDIAFGLENYRTPRTEIPGKVRDALRLCSMEGFEKRAPNTLSGGQKQRIALAGVLALSPDVIVFDEVTAMLDPEGREEVLTIIRRLRDEGGRTLIMITHYAEEAVFSDRVVIMTGGRVLGSGRPREVFKDTELMQSAGLAPPFPVRLYFDLRAAGVPLENVPLTNEELVEELCRLNLSASPSLTKPAAVL